MELIRPYLNFVFMILLVTAVILGFKRGWKGEAVTCVLLAVGIVALDAVGTGWWPGVQESANQVLEWVSSILRAVGLRDAGSPPVEVGAAPDLTMKVGMFAIMALVAYTLGLWVGSATEVGTIGRVLGGFLGCVNVFLLGLALVKTADRSLDLWMFEVTSNQRIESLGEGVIPPATAVAPEALWGWVSTASVFVVVALVAYFVSRLLKFRE